MKIDAKYFQKFDFSKEQIQRNLDNALKDLHIAQTDNILDVKFNYAFTALIKAGIALLSFYNAKVRSAPGHHSKIIEKMSEILKDDSIIDIGNLMRSKRNKDFYAGGVEITEKEAGEYIEFVEKVLKSVKSVIV